MLLKRTMETCCASCLALCRSGFSLVDSLLCCMRKPPAQEATATNRSAAVIVAPDSSRSAMAHENVASDQRGPPTLCSVQCLAASTIPAGTRSGCGTPCIQQFRATSSWTAHQRACCISAPYSGALRQHISAKEEVLNLCISPICCHRVRGLIEL